MVRFNLVSGELGLEIGCDLGFDYMVVVGGWGGVV